ncbi:MAG: extracellular solute-binding protein [Lachnospiraceae bacterium]|nr:extracellular solute-binding protein [Lachnospiraceae bacterium]
MKKMQFLALLLSVIMVLGTVGCTKTDDTGNGGNNVTSGADKDTASKGDGTSNIAGNTSSDEKITLRMAWWGSQTRHDRTVAVIELYESLHPNIDIEYEPMYFDGYFNKLATLVASNEVWDIFQLGSNFPTYQSKIYTLNGFIADGTIDVSGTTDAFLRIAADEQGNQVGLCSGVNTYGIAYDPALFAAAGVAEPAQNWTWDDYKQACLKIHEKLGIYGSSKFDDWQAGASMGINQEGFGIGFFNKTNDNLGFSDYKMLSNYLQMRADLVDAGAYPDPGACQEISDIENDFVVSGEAAMTWVASNQFVSLCTAAGRELKLINPPRKSAGGPAGVSIQSSQMLCVSSDSKYPAEAAKFIEFFQSNIEANQILLAERGIPTFTAVREALAGNLTDVEKAVYEYVDVVGAFDTGGETVNPSSPACTDTIKEQYNYYLNKVIYKEMTADEAAKAIYDFAASQF